MKRILTALVLLTFSVLSACQDENNVSVPGDVLSKEEMAAVMVDLNVLEASMNVRSGNADRVAASTESSALKSDVFAKHGLTREAFQHSFDFYGNHPKLFAEVYDLVLNEISRMQAQASSEKQN